MLDALTARASQATQCKTTYNLQNIDSLTRTAKPFYRAIKISAASRAHVMFSLCCIEEVFLRNVTYSACVVNNFTIATVASDYATEAQTVYQHILAASFTNPLCFKRCSLSPDVDCSFFTSP